ncbi:MAG: choice-of-anchor J domain-containing protein, partial [Bacteroidales bacterium]|nr:choice-of-anchor J domain-containing protein [Bacteroidales bacterium]
MRKIILLFSIFAFAISVMAQDAYFYKLPYGIAPVIDGQVDELWNSIETHNIDRPFVSDYDVPTLDVATWQAVWNDTAIFILINVVEDDHCDQWCSGEADWQSDGVEIYLDMNVDNLDDGYGPAQEPNGHYQFAWGDLGFQQDVNDYFFYGPNWAGANSSCAYSLNDPDYVYEYAIPFSSLLDEYGSEINPNLSPTIGFDVTIVDRDVEDSDRKRMVWMSDGNTAPSYDEAWNNMDACGEVQFAGGTPPPTFIIYSENFEDGASDWSMDGEWEVGNPTSGPGSAYEGVNCAATDLDDYYNNGAYYQLISPEILLIAAIDPQLSFREWYHLESCCDFMSIYISNNGGTNWQSLASNYTGNNGNWALHNISLSAYEGDTIQLRFLFTSDGSITYAGWYIDDIKITAAFLADTLPNLAVHDEDEWYDTNFVHEEYYSS